MNAIPRRRVSRFEATRDNHPSRNASEIRVRTQLAGRIANARMRAGLTQTALARKLGWTQGKIAHYETGRGAVHATSLPELCRALGTDPNTLLGWGSLGQERGG